MRRAFRMCRHLDGPDGRTAAATPTPTSRVKRVEITRRELFADGMAFGSVGAYEKLVGTATLELDLADPRNAPITDKDRALQATPGKIEYTTDLYIIRPVDAGVAAAV